MPPFVSLTSNHSIGCHQKHTSAIQSIDSPIRPIALKMKFVLILVFLVSALVATSPQQFHQQRNGQLWWSQYRQPQQTILQRNQPRVSHYYDPAAAYANPLFLRYSKPIHIRPTIIYSQTDKDESNEEFFDNQNLFADVQSREDYSPEYQQNEDIHNKLGRIVVLGHQYVPFKNQMVSTEPRIKNYKKSYFQDQQENRFLFNSDSTYNPFLRTVTLRVTSTCTSLSLITCIPADNLPAAPIPACRRKRNSEIDYEEDDNQFPINPTEIQTVTPTEQPSPAAPSVEMISSIEDEEDDELNSVGTQIRKQERKGKFLHLKNYFTSTTSTSWAVVSSTLTQTFIPAVDLACLPPGFVVC